jgi:transposase
MGRETLSAPYTEPTIMMPTGVNGQGAWANIPPKRNRKDDPICFSPYLYRARNLVERFFNEIKHCRRIATRYDKLAANYLAFVELASIRLYGCAFMSSRP